MTTVRLFFAGEGPDELGEWANEPAYRPSEDKPTSGGVLHALVGRYARYETVDAARWKTIRKFKAGDHAKPESRNVMGLALQADERQCDALVFVRDRDRDLERETDIEQGIESASRRFGVRIVGGTANEELEAWLLAMLGTRTSESFPDAKTKLAEMHGMTTREHKCQVVAKAKLDELPEDCPSLQRWLERAKAGLVPRSPQPATESTW
jgi:hypothetical protein